MDHNKMVKCLIRANREKINQDEEMEIINRYFEVGHNLGVSKIILNQSLRDPVESHGDRMLRVQKEIDVMATNACLMTVIMCLFALLVGVCNG